MQLARVRRLAEITFRRDAETLGREIELFEQPALRREAVDHALLAVAVFRMERNFDREGTSSSRRRPGPTCQAARLIEPWIPACRRDDLAKAESRGRNSPVTRRPSRR